jgi:aminoglycoside phosphotransferase (APT) family kinase protein
LSSETYLFETPSGGFVARLAPDGDGLFPVYDLARQARIMRVLGEHAVVPVPRVVDLVDDPHWLGAPFLVMERVEGRIPNDNPPFTLTGWVHDAAPEQQRALQDEFTDACARIHRADWAAIGLGDLAPTGSALAAELRWWSDYLDWTADGSPPPVLRDARDWCADNLPRDEPPPSLCWGDVRIPNVVFDNDLHVRAVLDWEMATVGPAELDVGWYLVIHEMTAENTGELPGFRPRADMLQTYAARLGRPLHDLTWYEAWAAFRSAAIVVRLAVMLRDLGLVRDLSLQEHNPSTDRLRALLA